MSFHFFFANKGDFLLDKIPSIVAISTSRKLSSNASYAMRIRRASDDAELDVGFAGNSIDNKAIKNFGGYNLLGYTEDLTNPIWVVGRTGNFPILVSSGITAPDGTSTAFNVRMSLEGATGAGDILDFKQNIATIAGKNYTSSFYLRSGDGVLKNLAFFNVIGNFYQITIGTEWQKYEFTNTSNSTVLGALRFRLQGNSTDNLVNLEVWHPQAEIGSSATQYQPRLAGGASNCFLTTLYDQSGKGNDANQTVVTNQPKIYDVATGEVTKENGKPAMVFDGVDDNIGIANVAGRSNIDAYFVNRHNPSLNSNNSAATRYIYPSRNIGGTYGFVVQKGSNSTTITSNYGSPNFYKNNILFVGTTRDDIYEFLGQTQNVVNHKGANVTSWDSFNFGGFTTNTFYFEGTFQEIIIFDRNLTTKERTLLHSDINNHFNIY